MNHTALDTFPIPTNFLEVMIELKLTKAEVLVYLYLLKHLSKGKAGEEMHFTYDELQRGSKYSEGVRLDQGTGLSSTSIKTAVDSLIDKGLIKVRKEGVGTQRNYHYSLRYPDGVNGTMLPMFSKNLTYPKKKSCPRPKLLEKDFVFLFIGDLSPSEIKSLSPFSPSEGKDEEEKKETLPLKEHADLPLLNIAAKRQPAPPDKFRLAAKQLWNAIIAYDPDQLNPKSNLTRWTNDFKDYSQKHAHFKWSTFKAVLDWYCDNLGKDRFMPGAFAAKSFCDKFGSIKRRMIDKQAAIKEDFHSTENLPPPEDDTPPQDDQLRRDSISHLL